VCGGVCVCERVSGSRKHCSLALMCPSCILKSRCVCERESVCRVCERVWECVWVCVRVCLRERECGSGKPCSLVMMYPSCIFKPRCVCVCVCERERERECVCGGGDYVRECV